MSLLTTDQVNAMRATVDKSFPDELEITRITRVYDGGGGYETSWQSIGTIPCRVGLPLGGETDVRKVSRVRLADEDLYTIWLSAEYDIRKLDRIIWESRTFEVNEVLQRGNWEMGRRIRVKEL